MEPFERLFDIVTINAEKYNDKTAFAKKVKGEWKKISFAEYKRQTDALSIWLINNGLAKGDRVISISNNRPEWNVVDMGAPQAGGIHVPLYPTYNKVDIAAIIEKCSPKFIFVAGPTMYTIVADIISQLACTAQLISLDEETAHFNFSTLVNTPITDEDITNLKNVSDGVDEDDLLTIAFTSGTGGDPNGAVFQHKQYVLVTKILSPLLGIASTDDIISYLPICHAFERLHSYCYQWLGVTTYYAESAATVIENLAEVKPAFFCSVPLMLERVYNAVYGRSGSFESFKQMAGGNLRAICTAGAPMPASLGAKYEELGIEILECYGISECNMVTYSLYKNHKLGYVGFAAPQVELKTTDEGEICVKSPILLIEYYKNPELTNIVMKNGWYHTGDLGEIDPDGFVKITGRKRDVFKVSSGKYIFPEVIEKAIKESALIENIYVFSHETQLTAILLINEAHKEQNESILADTVKNEIETLYNSKVFDSEKIQKIFIDNASVWTIEEGLLTPTMKIKRFELSKFYKDKLESIKAITI